MALPDPTRRGTGGPVFVQTAPDPHPIAYADGRGARSRLGIPTFDSNNGEMMEGRGGASHRRPAGRDGKRAIVVPLYTFIRTWTGRT